MSHFINPSLLLYSLIRILWIPLLSIQNLCVPPSLLYPLCLRVIPVTILSHSISKCEFFITKRSPFWSFSVPAVLLGMPWLGWNSLCIKSTSSHWSPSCLQHCLSKLVCTHLLLLRSITPLAWLPIQYQEFTYVFSKNQAETLASTLRLCHSRPYTS